MGLTKRRFVGALLSGLYIASGGQPTHAQEMELQNQGQLVIGYYPTAGGFDVKDNKVEGVLRPCHR